MKAIVPLWQGAAHQLTVDVPPAFHPHGSKSHRLQSRYILIQTQQLQYKRCLYVRNEKIKFLSLHEEMTMQNLDILVTWFPWSKDKTKEDEQLMMILIMRGKM